MDVHVYKRVTKSKVLFLEVALTSERFSDCELKEIISITKETPMDDWGLDLGLVS